MLALADSAADIVVVVLGCGWGVMSIMSSFQCKSGNQNFIKYHISHVLLLVPVRLQLLSLYMI